MSIAGFHIDPESWYGEDQLRLYGRPFDGDTLAAARKAGRLEYREPKRGQRVYKGAWLIAWLEGKAGGK